MVISRRLKELGSELPPPPRPVASYVPVAFRLQFDTLEDFQEGSRTGKQGAGVMTQALPITIWT
ncbi:MAG: hypothetical protein LC750_17490 [Actinobacteria bacterium]|nr:hypothetical protein [Actinomycetota bacterium]